jgi:NADH:ubiquinone oxidoreductase subunit F (NADH-binding)/NADH:ubiquinone oxidoreductase subunit E
MPKSEKFSGNMKSPGARRGKARPFLKGRQVDADALQEIQALLGDTPRQRDLLIEYLHLIHDRFSCLSYRHMAALAHELRLPMAEVFETATFYAHWDVVDDDAEPLPEITVRVCDSLTCEMLGGVRLMEELRVELGDNIRIVPGPCMGRCEGAPVACVGHNYMKHATVGTVETAIQGGQIEEPAPASIGFDDYVAQGGYTTLKACLGGDKPLDDVLDCVEKSGLRGLGGAGFPTARKWQFVRQEPKPRLMAVNADEGEPGTFKDRHYLETDPHRFLEGMLLAAWAVEAEDIYLYLRDEYPAVRSLLTAELDRIRNAGLADGVNIHLRRGAGAYICGEESAMLESIEGKRGLPRHKPPFPSQVGLFGRPTLINNVETLYWVRDILERGPDWYASQGRNDCKGPRSFSVSGRVKDPGVKFAPAGITVRQLIDEYCGGMADGHLFKAYLPGGASGGILPASLSDVPLDFGTLEEHGGLIGSAAVVVLSQADSVRASALNLMRFFEDESCGQCTPCRVGTEKAVKLMQMPKWDAALLEELGQCMVDASICGLGQAAPNPLRHVLKYFPEEVT